MEYCKILKIFPEILYKYASLKKKYLRTDHANCRTKELAKTFMTGPKLRSKFLRDRKERSRSDNQKQRKFYVILSRRAKQQYLSSVDKVSHKETSDLKKIETLCLKI